MSMQQQRGTYQFNTFTRRCANRIGVVVLALCAITSTLQAATGTWTGSAGATWDTSAGNWSGVSGTPWDNSNGSNNTAYFNTASAVAKVNGTVYANGITFDNTATITNGTISLTGASPVITANAAASLSNNLTLTGAPGFTKSGTATLTIGPTYNGGTITINNGTLSFYQANGDGIYPSTHSIVVNSGGTLANTGGGDIHNDVIVTINSNGTFTATTDTIGGITGSGTVNGNGFLTCTLPSDLTFDGQLTGGVRLGIQNTDSSTPAGTPRTFTLTNTNNNNTANNLMGIGGDGTDPGNRGDCTVKLGASEVITDNIQLRLCGNMTNGVGVAGSYQNALDMNGFNETIGGLREGAVQGTGTKPGLVTNSGATDSMLTINGGSGLTCYGIIADGAHKVALTKIGSTTQTLSGPNTYTGSTTVNAGTLLVNSPGSLAAGSAVTVSNGATLGGNGTINGTVTLISGATLSGSGLYNSNVTVAAGGTLSGTATYNGNVTVAAGGTLPGTATYNGPVNLGAGCVLSSPGGAGTYGTLAFANNGASALTLNGDVLPFDLSSTTNDQIAIIGNLVLNGANTIVVNFPSGYAAAGIYTLMTYAAKSGSGSLVLDKAYPNATLTVGTTSVTLTVSGGSTFVSGCVWSGPATGPWDTTTANWTRNGSTAQYYAAGDAVTFDDSDTAASSYTVTGTVASISASVPASVTFNNFANAYTLSSTIAGSGSLTKNGSGALTLNSQFSRAATTQTGASSNTVLMTDTSGVQVGMNIGGGTIPSYTYITAVTPNTSVTMSQGAASAGAITATMYGNVYSGGTTINGGTLTNNVIGLVNGTTIICGPTGIGDVTFSNAVTFVGKGNQWYIGTLALRGTLTLPDNIRTVVDYKTLDLGGSSRTIYVNGKYSAVTGGNTLANEGSGTSQWEMNHANWLTQVVTNGMLDLETTAFAGGANGNYGCMRFQNAFTWTQADLTVGSNILVMIQKNSFGNSAATSPNVTINSGGILNLTASTGGAGGNANVKSLAGGGSVFGSMIAANSTASILTLNGTSGSTDFSGVMSDGPGTGPLALTKSGASTQILSGNNTYSGPTTINAGGGTLQVGNGGSSGALGSGNVTNNATLVFNRSDSATVANSIRGSGALVKTGGGTITLSGTTAYAGGTTVSNGTLLVNGSVTGAVTVVAGARLGGTGVVAGSVTNLAGGFITAADTNSYGILTVTNLFMAENSTYIWNHGTSTGDTIVVNGNLTLPQVATVTVNKVSGTLPNPWVLISGFTNAATVRPDLSKWVFNGALPTTRAKVVGNQVVLSTATGSVIYVQ